MNISLKNYIENTATPSIRIYINKMENRITFKIKKLNHIELLMPKKVKLLGSTKTKIKNGENVPLVENIELVLVHSNIANNDYQHDSRVLHIFVPSKLFDKLLKHLTSKFYVLKNL